MQRLATIPRTSLYKTVLLISIVLASLADRAQAAVNTVLTLTDDNNPSFTSAPGNTFTLRAAILAANNTPVAEGFVDFKNGTLDLGTALVGSDGTASLTTSLTHEGTTQFTATFFDGSQANFNSSSGTLNQVAANHTVINGNSFCNPGTNSGFIFGSAVNAFSVDPQLIFVSGLSGTVKTVTVTFNSALGGISHLDSLLVAPDGSHSLDFFSSATSGNLSSTTFTLSDSGIGPVPGVPANNGVYVATDNDPTPVPFIGALISAYGRAAPAGTSTFGSAFSGIDPNGTWKLYAQLAPSSTGVTAEYGGFCLNFTTQTPPQPTTTTVNAPSQVLVGDSFTVTIKVSSGLNLVNQGAVQVEDNGNAVGAPVSLDPSGTTNTDLTLSSEGNHQLVFNYSDSSGTFGPSSKSVVVEADNHTIAEGGGLYCNIGTLTINNSTITANSVPYPSRIFISDQPQGPPTNIQLNINQLTTSVPQDIQIVLQGPPPPGASEGGGLVLQSGAGGATPVSFLSYTFDDSGNLVPQNSSALGGGIYAPTSYVAPILAPPAPQTPTESSPLGGGIFNNTFGPVNVNGTWSLYTSFDGTPGSGEGGGIFNGGWCLNFQRPAFTVTKTAVTPFQQGGTGVYTIIVVNSGNGPTKGEIDVLDTPATEDANTGLFITNISGTNWQCTTLPSGGGQCKRSDSVPAGGILDAIDVTVAIGAQAASPQSNTATVSGGGAAASATTTISTPVTAVVKLPTITSITASPNPALAGKPITFTLQTLVNGAPVTEGLYTINDGTTPLVSGLGLDLSGTTHFTVTGGLTGEGPHFVKAFFTGSGFGDSNGTVDVIINNPTTVNGNQYCNPGAITLGNATAPTNPYPSEIFVGTNGSFGLPNTIQSLTLTLNNMTVSDPDALQVMLVAPDGQHTLVVLGSAGGTNPVSDLNLTFDDAASAIVPGTGTLVSGTYRPTVNFGDTFPPPAPSKFVSAAPLGTGTLNGQFGGLNPNGTWKAFVIEDNPSPSPNDRAFVCLNFTENGPKLKITKTPVGTFTSGGTGQFQITVTNTGTAPTSGIVTLNDIPGAGGMMVTNISGGSNWTCNTNSTAGTGTCTTGTPIAPGGSQTFTVTVAVPTTTQTTLPNTANVFDQGGATDTTTVSVPIVQLPSLHITKTPVGTFTAGGTGQFQITITNTGGPTSGALTLKENPAVGTSMMQVENIIPGAGPTWSCSAAPTIGSAPSSGVCTTNGQLGAGMSQTFTVNVGIPTNSPSTQMNTATVSGGDAPTATITVPVSISPPPTKLLDTSVMFGTQVASITGMNRDLPWDISAFVVTFSNPIKIATAQGFQAVDSLGHKVAVTAVKGVGTNKLTYLTLPMNGIFIATISGLTDTNNDPVETVTFGYSALKCDYNGDGKVTVADAVGVNNAITQPYNPLADCNGDGKVDINDVNAVRLKIGTLLPN